MQLTNGDETQSKELVAKDIGKIWGTTKVNGKPEITRLPVEKVIGMPEGATALIQSDMANQLAHNLRKAKKHSIMEHRHFITGLSLAYHLKSILLKKLI